MEQVDSVWLSSAIYPDKSVAYTYDAVGNRATEVTTSPLGAILSNKTFTYDSRNRLTNVADATTLANSHKLGARFSAWIDRFVGFLGRDAKK